MRIVPSLTALFTVLSFSLAPIAVHHSPVSQTSSPPQPAGEIRALLPIAEILRGADPPRAAARSDAVFFRDLIRSGRASRVRIALTDGSILSLGAESELRIVEHSPDAQQTELNLSYGRLRSTVQRITRPAGRFEVRTPTAVVGVVGTRFFAAALADFTEIIALASELLVRNANAAVTGEVRLRTGQFTRVYPGRPPLAPADASPDRIADVESSTDIPFGNISPDGAVSPISISRAEASWPPPDCAAGAFVFLRAWAKQSEQGREVEVPVSPEALNGRLLSNSQPIVIEGSRMLLRSGEQAPPQNAKFEPAAVPSGSSPTPVEIFPPKSVAAGDTWRAPRAFLPGSIAYFLSPSNFSGQPQISFGNQPATTGWWGPCGAGVIVPVTFPQPARPAPVNVSVNGKPAARGQANIVNTGAAANLRPTDSKPPQQPGQSTGATATPAILRGQQANFTITISGLAGLTGPSPNAPIATVTVTNATPAILGDLKSSSPNARISGNTVTFSITPQQVNPSGVCTLRLSGRGLQPGVYLLNFTTTLAPSLDSPSSPLSLSTSLQ